MGLCRYAADSRQQISSGKHQASEVTDSEHQGGSEPARWRDKLHRPGSQPASDDLRPKALLPVESTKQSSAIGSLHVALLDMQRTIGSVLVIPTFRIVVLQVSLILTGSLCLFLGPVITRL